MFTAASTCPEQAWKRLAGESSAWVLLANANDVDSLRSTRADLEFVKGLGKVPFVVATYMSMAGEEMTAKQIAKALGLDARTPVLSCHLRDRESVRERGPGGAGAGGRRAAAPDDRPASRRAAPRRAPVRPAQRRPPLVFAAPGRED